MLHLTQVLADGNQFQPVAFQRFLVLVGQLGIGLQGLVLIFQLLQLDLHFVPLFQQGFFGGPELVFRILTQAFDQMEGPLGAATGAQPDQGVAAGQVVQDIDHEVAVVGLRHHHLLIEEFAYGNPEFIEQDIGVANDDNVQRPGGFGKVRGIHFGRFLRFVCLFIAVLGLGLLISVFLILFFPFFLGTAVGESRFDPAFEAGGNGQRLASGFKGADQVQHIGTHFDPAHVGGL